MFYIIRIPNGRMPVPENEPHEVTAGEAVSYGEALVLASGKLTKCGATTVPTHIAMADISAAQTVNRAIPCARVQHEQLYRVPVMASPTALKDGEKVTLHTDGLQVTSTTSSGVAEIVDKNGATAAGDEIIVRF